MSVPYDGCFALICYSYRGNLLGSDVHFRYRLGHNAVLTGIYLHRIVLDPALLRIYLREFSLRNGNDLSARVEDHGAGARRPLVKRKNVFFHI